MDSATILKLSDNLVKFVGQSLDAVRREEPYAADFGVESAPHLALAIGSAALSFVPYIGPILGALVFLLGEALFPKDANPAAVWSGIVTNVATLVDERIEKFYLELLTSEVEGLAANMKAFQEVWQQWERAKAADDKAVQAETLRAHYVGFVAALQRAVPQFQVRSYQVAALSQFALAANLHLTMLTLGYTDGAKWGFTDAYVKRSLFQAALDKTGQTAGAVVARNNRTSEVSNEELGMLSDAIRMGKSRGWSAELVHSWEDAYAHLGAEASALVRRDPRPYTDYVSDVYAAGRTKVKPYPLDDYLDRFEVSGSQATVSALRAFADYDAEMIRNVFAYSVQWKEMVLQKGLSQDTLRQLDREVWSGPYFRFANDVYDRVIGPQRWNSTFAPAVVPRSGAANISGLVVRADEAVHYIETRYSDGTTQGSGNPDKGHANYNIRIDVDDPVRSVDLKVDYVVKGLALRTKKAGLLEANTTSADVERKYRVSVSHAGYALSTIFCNRWIVASNGGIEGATGIVMGWRPDALIETMPLDVKGDGGNN